jgi:hypothetical protein
LPFRANHLAPTAHRHATTTDVPTQRTAGKISSELSGLGSCGLTCEIGRPRETARCGLDGTRYRWACKSTKRHQCHLYESSVSVRQVQKTGVEARKTETHTYAYTRANGSRVAHPRNRGGEHSSEYPRRGSTRTVRINKAACRHERTRK